MNAFFLKNFFSSCSALLSPMPLKKKKKNAGIWCQLGFITIWKQRHWRWRRLLQTPVKWTPSGARATSPPWGGAWPSPLLCTVVALLALLPAEHCFLPCLLFSYTCWPVERILINSRDIISNGNICYFLAKNIMTHDSVLAIIHIIWVVSQFLLFTIVTAC